MTNNLYAAMACIGFVVMLLLLNIALELKRRDSRMNYLYKLFAVLAIFCLSDFLWGLIAYKESPFGLFEFNIASILFHMTATISAYAWFIYILRYHECVRNKFLCVAGAIPVVIGATMIASNSFNNCIFIIDEDMNYYSGNLRNVLFIIQYFYFVTSVIHSLYRLIKSIKAKEADKHDWAMLVYSATPIFFGMLQMKYTHAPYYSLGYMLTAVVIFAENIYREEGKRLKAESDSYKSKYTNYSSAFEAMGETYVAIHVIDLAENDQHVINSNSIIDDFVNSEETADKQIIAVVKGTVDEDYMRTMLDFVKLSTLPERMKDKNILSREFKTKSQKWCMSSFIRVSSDEEGNPVKVLHAVQNVDDVKKKEIKYSEELKKALKNKNIIYYEMLQSQSNGVIATDLSDTIISINDAAATIFGHKNYYDCPSNIYELMEFINIEGKEDLDEQLAKLKNQGESIRYSFSIAAKDGTEKYILANAKRVTVSDGSNVLITSLTDITQNKEYEKGLKALSEIDNLTGINNRGCGEKKISEILESGGYGMFGLIDLDFFKSINDTFGHKAGDMALVAVAKALTDTFPDKDDVVMRLGGDEFAIFAKQNVNPFTSTRIIEELFERINAIGFKEYPNLKISISVGIYYTYSDIRCSFDEAYQKADSVMYESKKIHGNAYTVFE